MYFIHLYKWSTLKSRLKKKTKKGKKDLLPTASADCFFIIIIILLFIYLFTETRVRTFVIKCAFVYTYENKKYTKTQTKDETRCLGVGICQTKPNLYNIKYKQLLHRRSYANRAGNQTRVFLPQKMQYDDGTWRL